MKSIKIISIYKTSIEYRGFKMAFGTWFGFIFFCGGGGFIAYSAFSKDQIKEGFVGLGMALLYLLILFFLLRSRVYIPKKSFWWERRDKEVMLKYTKYSFYLLLAILVLCIILGFTNILEFRKSLRMLVSTLGGLITLYFFIKSIKVHNDIDYAASEELSGLLDFQFDEKIVASYQNFDSSEDKRKKNDNLIVVTNRKIFFAVFNGTNWMTLNKLLSEVEKIGIARNDVNSYLKLVFADNTKLGLRLDLYEKITTTPQLFVKQFLSTLDAYLMGYDVVSSNNRRRVSISQENASVDNNSSNQKRSIELNQTLVNELKTSEEIKSGRILEI
jgi:hypothetical protein